jgi:hypothetical protein
MRRLDQRSAFEASRMLSRERHDRAPPEARG